MKRDDAIFCLVGNKLDLNEKRQVTTAEGEAVANEKNFIFQEVSAKSGMNINNLFYKDIFSQISCKYKLNDTIEDGGQNDQRSILIV